MGHFFKRPENSGFGTLPTPNSLGGAVPKTQAGFFKRRRYWDRPAPKILGTVQTARRFFGISHTLI